VPPFVILVDVDALPVAAAADAGIVSHGFSYRGKETSATI
jgi:hypothetical protein